MICKCLYCGNEFEGKTRRHKYCSSRCKEAYRVSKLELHQGVCRGCGKPITYKLLAGVHSKQYCSVACQLSHTVPTKTLTCVDCGKQFEFHGRTTKLRCDSCWHKYRSKCAMAARALKDPTVQLGVGSGGGQNNDLALPDAERHDLNETRRKHYAANRERMRAIARSRYRDKALASNTVCEICGYSNRDALIVHHKDMDRANSDSENLAVLCANCHTRLHKMIKTLQKTQQLSAVSVFNMFKEAEVKSRNEAEKPDGAIRTEGCVETQSGATHTITSSPDMRWHEAATEQE